jgi:hypothetical protein
MSENTRTVGPPRALVAGQRLASEPYLPHPDIAPGEQPRPLEEHLRPRRPVAVVGVVENGLVRLIDPRLRLPEQSRVIVVASEPS